MTAGDLVIFDLDGTLVDSAPDIARAVGLTLREAGLEPPPLEAVKAMVGDGARVLIARALAAAGVQRDVDALMPRFLAHYTSGLCIDTRLYEGISELLERLGEAGVRTAVLTNKPGGLARELLARLGIGAAFAAVVGDGDGYPRKPDPTAARALLQRAGVPPRRAAVVGDGLPDLQVAQALGVPALSVGWGYVPPERLRAAGASVVLPSVGDLAQALGVYISPRSWTQRS